MLLAILSVAALFGITYGVHAIGNVCQLSSETQRKTVHVAVGLHALLLPFLLDRNGFLIFVVIAAAALIILRSPGMRDGMGAAIHGVERRSWGDLLLLMAITILFLVAEGDPVLYVLPIAVLTLSDASAAIVGSQYGRIRFGTGDRLKSIEGSTAFFVVTWMVCTTILISATEIPRENIIWLSFFVAGFASLIEADSWRGLDNLFVPVGIYALLYTWGQSPPATLVAWLATWIVVALCMSVLAPRLGTTAHAARATLVALFLTAGIVRWPSAVFPILALTAYLVTLRQPEMVQTDGLPRYPDFVLVIVILGIFWLSLGALTGRDGTAFYIASFAGVACGLGLAILNGRSLVQRAVFGVGLCGVTALVYFKLIYFLNSESLWLGQQPLLATVIIGTMLTSTLVLTKSRFVLGPNRSWRLGIVALAAPAFSYLYGSL